MNPPKSLNAEIGWTSVLPMLNVPLPRTRFLSATVTCPLCQKDKLRIDDDRVLGGQWASCSACSFAGDMIELAAAKWRTDIRETLFRLRDLFLDPPTEFHVADYIEHHNDYRRRFRDFWEAARQAPPHQESDDVRELFRKINFFQHSQREDWLNHAGLFLGSANRRDVENLFFLASYEDQDRFNHNGRESLRRGGGPGGRRIFNGEGWEDVLVIPYFDLPGRVCGFQFIGRQGDSSQGDWIYRRANLGCSSLRVREAGVAMLPALGQRRIESLEDDVFIFCDLPTALRLRSRAIFDSEPLPLFVAHVGQDVQTLALPGPLAERRAIFWGGGVQSLVLAKRCGGFFSNYDISRHEIGVHGLRHRPPVGWLMAIRKKAVHWEVALSRILRELDHSRAESLLRQLEFAPDELRDLQRRSPVHFGERLAACDPHRIGSRRLVSRGRTILETPSGWQIEKTGEMIASLPIRIEQILRTDEKAMYYRGTVPHGDKTILFTIPCLDVDRRGLFVCIRDALLDDEIAFQFQKGWNRHALYLAMRFSDPKVVPAANRIGFSFVQNGFVFPNFFIGRRDDQFRFDRLPILTEENAPGQRLQATIGIGIHDLELLSSNRAEVGLCWALMTCIMHNLFATMVFRKNLGILLDGEGAQTAGVTLARALGSATVDLRRKRPLALLDHVAESCLRHDWPSIVPNPAKGRLPVSAAWIDAPGIRNAILTPDELTAPVMAANPGFVRITLRDPLPALGHLQDAVARLIPMYVRDACQRNLRLRLYPGEPIRAVLEDIAGWFERIGGKPRYVRRAHRYLSIGSLAPWRCFLDAAFRLIDRGELLSKPREYDRTRRRKPAIVYDGGEGARPATSFLPAREVNAVLARLRIPIFDLDAVRKSFEATPGWMGVGSYRGEEGWFFEREWLEEDYVRRHLGRRIKVARSRDRVA